MLAVERIDPEDAPTHGHALAVLLDHAGVPPGVCDGLADNRLTVHAAADAGGCWRVLATV